MFRRKKRVPNVEAVNRAIVEGFVGDYRDDDRYRDFKRVFMATPEGKRVLWEIFRWTGMNDISFIKDSPEATAFNEGQRNIGLMIYAVLNDPKDTIDE